jgi:hypothetical protein
MARVDSILETRLFTNNNFRNGLIAFVETGLKNDLNFQEGLNNIPYSVIFNRENILKEEISLRIRNAKILIDFDHNSNDKILQNLIFLFLIFCSNEYPSNNEWESFLNETYDFKRAAILKGINNIWLSYQEQLIKDNLHGDYIDGDVHEFPF